MNDHRRAVAFAAACLLGFLVLLALVAAGGGPVQSMDNAVRNVAAAHRNGTLAAVGRYLTDVLSPGVDALVLAAGAAVAAWRLRRGWPLVAAGTVGWVMAVVVIGVKHVVGRPGPTLPATSHGLSFPSGHTASALVCLGALALLGRHLRPAGSRWLLPIVAALTTLVAAALVYDGYHWLSDCLASVALGAGLLVLLDRWLSRRTASPSSAAGTPPIDRTAHRR